MKNNYIINKLFYISTNFPKTLAVEQGVSFYTYEDFTNIVLNLTKKILAEKATPIVAIVGEKDILSYTSMFSVLYSGGTYVPISANLPLNKTIKIINSTKIDLIICKSGVAQLLKKKFPSKKFFTQKDLSNHKCFSIPKIKTKKKTAYIMFTSGSTGNPKGVCISRSSLDHYIKWFNKNIKIKKSEKCSQFPEIGFDLSVADIYGTLCSGGTLCPANSNYSKVFPGRFLAQKKISCIVCVPSLIDIINNSGDLKIKNFSSIKKVFFCGEPLLKKHAKNLFRVNKKIKIINSYGPTEATVSCTKKLITPTDLKKNKFNSLPLGKPIDGVKIRLLNNNKYSKKEGEIVIFGKQVAMGYLNEKENKNKFFISKKEGAYFKTGDYAEIVNGEMYFKNRLDTQVKIKGHRIELDEINNYLNRFGLENVHTIILMEKIISFYSDKFKFNRNSLIKYLKKNIPEYMIPNYLLKIKKFPLNQNGKVLINDLIKKAKKKINEN